MRAATHKIPWELTVKAKARPEDGRAFCFLSVSILPKCGKLHANFFCIQGRGIDGCKRNWAEVIDWPLGKLTNRQSELNDRIGLLSIVKNRSS